MRRALAQNPNMLRTIVGLGMTLILILSYAVYSATLDSGYYLAKTSNDARDVMVVDDPINGSYTFSTEDAISWINVTIDNAPFGSIMEVTAVGGVWWYHPNLGIEMDDNVPFQCFTPDTQDYEGIAENCESSAQHSSNIEDGTASMRGILTSDLPLSGTWAILSDNLTSASLEVNRTLEDAQLNRTWTIRILDDTGSPMNSTGTGVQVGTVHHDLISVEQFTIDPITELIWSMTALVGCFGVTLILPVTLYLAALAKTKKAEAELSSTSDSEE
ncbi:MAG TPA: hypothetical protein HA345_00300 [Candidatus Thalassarchaeaceae archaeon]|jgi:hypothetical protein|nr:MAG TPA: hypothetical protein D7H94_00300 [Candidatus Poseidoniales archaeon]HIH83826.1 hypothetical protein [Candidatus Thalassarchaeaceae archaeon]|tara:strand:- start:1965 stop:2783 length:819 start_codon:yes stop_codon:yes gene_type:complete